MFHKRDMIVGRQGLYVFIWNAFIECDIFYLKAKNLDILNKLSNWTDTYKSHTEVNYVKLMIAN